MLKCSSESGAWASLGWIFCCLLKLLQSIIPNAARALKPNKSSWKKKLLSKTHILQTLLGEFDAAVCLQERTTLVILWLTLVKIFCSLYRRNWSSLKKELLGSFVTKEAGILDVTSIQISSKSAGKCCDLKRKPVTSWRVWIREQTSPQFRMPCWFLPEENLCLMDHQENPLWQLNADGSCTYLEQLTSHVAAKNSARSGTTRASLNLDI